MFAMNQEDSLAVMEHAAVVRTAFGRVDAEDEAAHDAVMRRGQTAMLGIRSAQLDKQKLHQQAVKLAEMQNAKNDVAAVGLAAAATINDLIAEVARLSGRPEREIKISVNSLRTKHYDRIVDDFLCTGVLQKDFRTDAEHMKVRDWYTP
jgi:hypothetical protein